VIEAARQNVSRENSRVEDVVSGLEEARQQLEREKELAESHRLQAAGERQDAQKPRESLESEAEKELARAREKARAIVEQVKLKSDQLLNELDDLKKQKDKADFSATVNDVKATFRSYLRDLENEADPITKKKGEEYRLPRPLRRGDSVFLTELNSRGTVLAEPDQAGYVQVQAGIIKTKVRLTALRLDENDRRTTLGGGAVSTKAAVKAAKRDASSEIDLRGMDSIEAIFELDRYIDQSLLSGIPTVTVIHGKGTGALRSAIQAHLKGHKAVKTYRAGTYGEGEAGVTVVELK
jgi:DNA mismatch repair protein MutS2